MPVANEQFQLFASVDDLPGCVARRFAAQGGAVGSPDHLRLLEKDRRWSTSYYVHTSDGRAVAAIPLARPSMRRWTDPLYHPGEWFPGDVLDPRRCLLAGGWAGFSNMAWVDQDWASARSEVIVRDLYQIAEREDRSIVMAYVTNSFLDVTAEPRPTRRQLLAAVRFDHLLQQDQAQSLSGKQRYVWRKDERAASEMGLQAEVTEWSTVADEAAPVMAAHNLSHGAPDAAELVHYRLSQWASVRDTELCVFTATAGGERAYVTGLVHGGDLTLQEIGITAPRGPLRTQLYVHSVVHLPVLYARTRGLRTMRVGLEGSVAKTSRGGRLEGRSAMLISAGRLNSL